VSEISSQEDTVSGLRRSLSYLFRWRNFSIHRRGDTDE